MLDFTTPKEVNILRGLERGKFNVSDLILFHISCTAHQGTMHERTKNTWDGVQAALNTLYEQGNEEVHRYRHDVTYDPWQSSTLNGHREIIINAFVED